jgi:hypothetical protein
MNRASSLRWSLPSWLASPQIDEFVIVDWSSKSPLHEELSCFHDSRLRFVRVEGQTYWCAARCHNVELLAARHDALLRIDSDVRIAPEFFTHHPLADEKIFWNLTWEKATCDEDRHLAGAIYTRRKNYLLVKGYNEHLQSYGFEDDDLFCRMTAAGLVKKHSRKDQLQHLPHDNADRLVNIAPNFVAGPDPNKSIMLNLHLSGVCPWSATGERMAEWNVVRVNDRLCVYTPKVSEVAS